MQRHRTTIFTIFLSTLVLLTGCGAVWKQSGGKVTTAIWRAEIPDAWMCLENGDYKMFSKDGPQRQYILIQTRPLARPFHHVNRGLDANMLPHEAARVIMQDLRTDDNISQLEFLENQPALIDGRLGFKLSYRYLDNRSVPQRTHLYGLIAQPHFVSLRYTAAEQRYFQKSITDFEGVLQSFSLIN